MAALQQRFVLNRTAHTGICARYGRFELDVVHVNFAASFPKGLVPPLNVSGHIREILLQTAVDLYSRLLSGGQ